MKSPLRKWRGLALYKHGHKQKKEDALATHQAELLQAAEVSFVPFSYSSDLNGVASKILKGISSSLDIRACWLLLEAFGSFIYSKCYMKPLACLFV